MLDKSLMRKIAFPRFLNSFADLVSHHPQITTYEAEIIQATYELVFFGHYSKDQTDSLINTARVAYKIMESGAVTDFDVVATAFLINSERAIRQTNRCWGARVKALQDQELDSRIERFLHLYKTLYEALAPIVLAPVVVALGVVMHSNQSLYKLDRDGRVRLSALEKIQHYSQSSRKQLSIGLNSHLRNAFSHDRFRLMDGGKVELWDTHPGSCSLTWGPETWSVTDVEKICESLWRNCLGLLYAWAIFSINNRQLMNKSGLISRVQPAHDPVRSDELRQAAEHYSGYRGFRIKDFSFSNGAVILKLQTIMRGVDQDSEILMSQRGNVTKYTVKMEYLDLPVIDQLVGLLQELEHQLGEVFDFDIAVINPQGLNIGRLVGNTDVIPEKKIPIDELRKRFIIDTIPYTTMPVLVESYPREIE